MQKKRKFNKYEKFMLTYLTCVCDRDCDVDRGLSDVCYQYTQRSAKKLKEFYAGLTTEELRKLAGK